MYFDDRHVFAGNFNRTDETPNHFCLIDLLEMRNSTVIVAFKTTNESKSRCVYIAVVNGTGAYNVAYVVIACA